MRKFLLLALALSPACGDSRIAGGSVDGAEIFQTACARCHGAAGVPDRGMAARTGVKPLTSERVRTKLSDDQLRDQILNGSKNRMMPAFQGAMSEEQVVALVAHVRTLGANTSGSQPSPAPAEKR